MSFSACRTQGFLARKKAGDTRDEDGLGASDEEGANASEGDRRPAFIKHGPIA